MRSGGGRLTEPDVVEKVYVSLARTRKEVGEVECVEREEEGEGGSASVQHLETRPVIGGRFLPL